MLQRRWQKKGDSLNLNYYQTTQRLLAAGELPCVLSASAG